MKWLKLWSGPLLIRRRCKVEEEQYGAFLRRALGRFPFTRPIAVGNENQQQHVAPDDDGPRDAPRYG
jgi:hypothetical protein